MYSIICLLPVIPIRKEPSHKAEQTSQLIFGEKADVIHQHDDWIEVKTQFDRFTGWIDKHSVEVADNRLLTQKTIVTTEPITICEYGGEKIYLTAGSEIGIPDENNFFRFEDYKYKLISPLPLVRKFKISELLETSLKFLNAPYLWGGRSVFGIDCSGFVQIVFKIHGKELPRDAKDQANAGILIKDFEDRLPGDLVFFDNEEGRITHVGIVFDEKLVIHSSIQVKIDHLDEKGIYNLKRNEYTHSLRMIKRIATHQD